MTLLDERMALYRFYDGAGALLYVGITNSPGRRWTEHFRAKSWWAEVKRQTVDWLDSEQEALEAEKAAIRAEKPKYNVVYGTFPAEFREWPDEPADDPAPGPEAVEAPPVRWADTEDGKRIVEERRAEIRARYERLYANGAKPGDLDPDYPSATLEYRMGIELVVAEMPPLTAEQKRRLRPLLAGVLPSVLERRARDKGLIPSGGGDSP